MATITLNPTIDSFMRAGAYASTNYGSAVTINAGEYSASLYQRGLIKFDFTIYQGISLVSNPVLRLYRTANDATNTRVFSLYVVSRDWTEDGVTWNKYNGTDNWATAGGMGVGDYDSGIGAIAATSITGSGVNAWDEWEIDKTKIPGWFNGTLTNYGMILKAGTESEEARRWASKESALGSDYYPQFVMEYTRGGGGVIMM